MKHSLGVAVVVCAVGVAAWGQNPVSAMATGPVVTVSFNGAVMATAEARRDFAALQGKFAPRQSQVQALNDGVEALRKQLSAGGNKLSDAEKATREQSLSAKEKQLERAAEDMRNDWQAESQQIFERIAQKAYAVLQNYARSNGYGLVVDRGSDATPMVWYAAPGRDITEAFLKAYDAQAGVTAPPGAVQPSAIPREAPKNLSPPPH